MVHCQSGLKEYIAANPAFKFEHSATVLQSRMSDGAISSSEYEDSEVQDEFYDAMADDSSSSSSSEESDDDHEKTKVIFHSWKINIVLLMYYL